MKPGPCASKEACAWVSGALDRLITHFFCFNSFVVASVVVVVVVKLVVTTDDALESLLCVSVSVWFEWPP